MARPSAEVTFAGAGLVGTLAASGVAEHVGAFFTQFVANTAARIRQPDELHEYMDFGTSSGAGINVNAALTVAALAVMSYMAYRMWSARGAGWAGWSIRSTYLWQLCSKVAQACTNLKDQTLYYLRTANDDRSDAEDAPTVLVDQPSIERVAVAVHMGTADNPEDIKAQEAELEPVMVPSLDAEGRALEHVRLWLGEFRSDWAALKDQPELNPRSFLTRLLQFSEVIKTLQADVTGGYNSPVLLYNLEDVRKGGKLPIISIKVHEWGMNVVNAMVQPKGKDVLVQALVGLVVAITNLLDADHMVTNEQYAHVPAQLQYEFHAWTQDLPRDQQRIRFWKWASIMTHFMVVVPQLVLNSQKETVTTVPLLGVSQMKEGVPLTGANVTEELSKVASPEVVTAVVQNIQRNGGRLGGLYVPMAGWHSDGQSVSLAGVQRAAVLPSRASLRPTGRPLR